MRPFPILALLAAACAAGDGTKDVDTDADTDAEVDTEAVDTELPGGVAVVATHVVCADPAARSLGPWAEIVRAPKQVIAADGEQRLVGGGLAAADLDGDGRMDVVLPGIRETALWWQNAQGTFDEASAVGLRGIDLAEATGATVIDIEGDGDLDLFVTRWNLPHRLLRNNGDRTFTEIGAAAGFDTTSRSLSSSWGDLDGDGDLDLFVGTYGPRPDDAHAGPVGFVEGDPSELWENQGDGTFVDRSELLPPAVQQAHLFQSAWLDLDLDGDLDLITVHDFGWNRPSQILWNHGGTLVPDDGSAGFDKPFAGMGLGVGDLNGDELPDFLQSSWRDLSILVSTSGSWWEFATTWGISPDWEGEPKQVFGWGAELADIDVDGDHDALVMFGYWDEYGRTPRQVDGLWIQTGPGTWVEQAALWSFDDPGTGRGLLVADLNGDGWPDVLQRVLGKATPMLLSQCGDAGWLKVRLRSSGANTFGIGARIRAVSGSQVWTRTIGSGSSSLFSGGPPEALFGFGDLDRLDLLEVHWPDGEITRVDDLDTRQVVELSR